MKKLRTPLPIVSLVAVIAVAVVLVVLSAGPTSRRSASASQPGNAAIGVCTTSVGKALVDANGRTLYLFEADARNVSKLPAAGRAEWPPFTTTASPLATGGAVATSIGTIAGPAGRAQVTYNGHPLYYFAGDHNAGDTSGQGLKEFGALWYALTPAGAANTSAANTSSGGASSGGY